MTDALAEDIKMQIETQGVASYKVSDGEVFVFTSALLEKLLEKSREQGRVVVFVKTRPTT
jgi:hypothetical protein